MARGIPGYLRYRVVNLFDAGNSVLTDDLPHLHASSWSQVGFQPGMPSGSMVGSFRIPLPAPGTKEFKAAYPSIYSKLARYQRVEAYLGYSPRGIGLGKLAFAGPITGMHKNRKGNYELIGTTDLGYANKSRPFPGELMSNDVTSAILKSYLGRNELGWADTFNPFTAGNYTSTALPGGASGGWAGATDDGLNTVNIGTGTAAVLISKVGAAAQDRWHTQYVEMQCRLLPSNDAANAGQVGIGFSQSSANGNNSILGFITAQKINGRYQLQCGIQDYSGGAVLKQQVAPTILYANEDPSGKIPLTIGLLFTIGGNVNGTATASLIVNGSIVLGQFQTGYDPQNLTFFPFIEFLVPASGVAQAYMTNLMQFVRPTADGPLAPLFASGSIPVAGPSSLGYGVDPGPTFLDAWGRLATREGWYLRYRPQSYVLGTRTIGAVDFAADPGADLTASAIFRWRDGTLVDLETDDSGDPLSSGTEMSGLSSQDGGGIARWYDVATAQAIGLIEDQVLGVTNVDFNTLRAAARRVMVNKVALDTAGHMAVEVVRAPGLADTYTVLDRIKIDDPEQGVNNVTARIMARTFTEGARTERLTLNQFSWHGEEFALR